MFIELVDVLRCIREHEDSWLVAAAYRMEARDIVEGELGCHICGARYPVREGVADFTVGTESGAPTADTASSGAPESPSADDLMRAAAMLHHTEGPGFTLLAGAWSRYATALAAMTPVPIIVMNPLHDISMGGGVSGVLASNRLPFANASARAAAFDEKMADDPLLTEAVRVLRDGARLVAPATAAVPRGTQEIARDEAFWVAQREPRSAPLVGLTGRDSRRPPSPPPSPDIANR